MEGSMVILLVAAAAVVLLLLPLLLPPLPPPPSLLLFVPVLLLLSLISLAFVPSTKLYGSSTDHFMQRRDAAQQAYVRV
ncbi:hypothetical protein BS78_03G406800 [Paspalum vaginatum]|nr:hypothetical protein BS78_03G406800 [Paspalum vaginatum]